MLTADTQAPEVAKATMGTDLLQALKIVTQLGVQVVRRHLGVLAILDVLLSIEEPVGDLVLARVEDDRDETLHLLLRQLTGTLVEVHIGLLADNVRETASDSLDRGERKHGLAVTIDIRVHNTQNVLKTFGDDQRHGLAGKFKTKK